PPSFFLPPSHPLSSSLFPYTTLFRSKFPQFVNVCVRVRNDSDGNRRQIHVTNLGGTLCFFLVSVRATANYSANPISNCHDNDSLDRKSTRLNSSHVSISYAVFCLKKR